MAGGVNPDYKIRIDEAVLFARKAKLNPAVQMGPRESTRERDGQVSPEKGTLQGVFHTARCYVVHTRQLLFGRPTEESSVVLWTTMPTTGRSPRIHSMPNTTNWTF